MPNNKGNIVLPLISAIAILAFVAAGLFFYIKSHKPLTGGEPRWRLMGENPKLFSQNTTSTPTPTAQNETANWKTYTNEELNFSLKYPPNLSVDLKNQGFISSSDYYGKRDANILITDPAKGPIKGRYLGDPTGHPSVEYDGYNFAIFSGDSATKQVAGYQDTVNNGKSYSPPIEKEDLQIMGQTYSLYYVPPSNLQGTDKTSYWFINFPLGTFTVIVTGNYDKGVLKQILSTFKFP